MVPSFLAGRCGTSRYIRNPASDVLDTTTAQALQWLAVVAALPAVNSITNNIVLYCTVLYCTSPLLPQPVAHALPRGGLKRAPVQILVVVANIQMRT